MKELLISVIIPVYNAERYIEKCVNSITNQTYTKLEILIIDDGSTDNSLLLCNKLKAKDGRITVVHQENGGVSSARNKGISLCNGDYVIFIDSDDYLELNTFSEAVSVINREHPSIVKFQHIKEIGLKKTYSNNSIYGLIEDKDTMLDLFVVKHEINSLWSSLFEKNIVKNISFNCNYSYGEDYLFYFDAINLAKSMFIMSEKFYHYTVISSSLTHSFDKDKEYKKILDHYSIDKYVREKVDNKNYSIYLIETTFFATKNWLKQISVKNNYKNYKILVDLLKNNQLYKEYRNVNVNYKKTFFKYMGSFMFYIKFRIIGVVKDIVRHIMERI